MTANILRERIDLEEQSVLLDEQFVQIAGDNRRDLFAVSRESELLGDAVRLRGCQAFAYVDRYIRHGFGLRGGDLLDVYAALFGNDYHGPLVKETNDERD